MLESVKIARRQSEIRQALSALVGKATPTEDETRSMESLDTEYRTNETRYRAALIAEDQERRDAKDSLETRGSREWSELVGRFELRQVALALDEGRTIDGATAEVVTELRNRGGGRAGAIPVPWAALRLETRSGETTASDVPSPTQTRDIIDKLFPRSIASAMGGDIITIEQGNLEFPLTTDGCNVAWQSSETGSVGAAAQFKTANRTLKPDYTMGAQMVITRKALKQSGTGLEMAVRRDLNAAIAAELDRVVFNGAGATGEPLGLIPGATTYGINSDDLGDGDTWAVYRGAIKNFMEANAIGGPGGVRLAITPALWDALDDKLYDTGSGVSELDKLLRYLSPVVTNQLESGQALLTCTTNGVPPFAVGLYGSVDVIRDVWTQAASGQLVITALATIDVSAMRASQIEILEASGG